MSSHRSIRVSLVALVVLSFAGCAEPPTKELSQAHGAIETARAAGAATFATDELAAAEAALARANQAVTERDYRSALSHAIDSNTRAQAAAKAAVDGRVQARLAVEQTLNNFGTLLSQLASRLDTPEARRMPRAVQRRAAGAQSAAAGALERARAAVEAGDLSAAKGLAPHTAAVTDALQSLQPPSLPVRAGRAR